MRDRAQGTNAPADFHRRTFAHKFGEALTLLSALGANSLKVSADQGWSREFTGDLDVSLPLRPAGDEGQVAGRAHSSRSFLYTAELKGSSDPRLPKKRTWFHHEPEWQAWLSSESIMICGSSRSTSPTRRTSRSVPTNLLRRSSLDAGWLAWMIRRSGYVRSCPGRGVAVADEFLAFERRECARWPTTSTFSL